MKKIKNIYIIIAILVIIILLWVGYNFLKNDNLQTWVLPIDKRK